MPRSPPAKKSKSEPDCLTYHHGFGNDITSEALPQVVPEDQRSPQRVNYGLYAEQLSGTAFTVPRKSNQRVWLYRILPSVTHKGYHKVDEGTEGFGKMLARPSHPTPQQYRWKPHPLPGEGGTPEGVNFLEGLVRYCGAGHPDMKAGIAVYQYAFDSSMIAQRKAFFSSDGDYLIVPQLSTLRVRTELGDLFVEPQEVVVVPRGMKFAIASVGDAPARGYCAEVYDGHFALPERSVIGTTGLADERHFQVPTARYDSSEESWKLFHKFVDTMWSVDQAHSPFDVVGWSGNYCPFKYDLRKYTVLNTVSVDHIDPSIFCVMSVLTNSPGTAALDFVIFPPRWGVANGTFRPPYFHRNCMSEYMGLITGHYEAKAGGFLPGGASLHSMMAAHGPDVQCFEKASTAELLPERVAEGTMSFMFESSYSMMLTDYACSSPTIDKHYMECWEHKRAFDPNDVNAWSKHLPS